MAVYTEVSFEEAACLLQSLGLGTLQRMSGCEGGIENTNYFVDTDIGQYVLTLFERLSAEQLPFYLRLMQHLAQRGVALPTPQASTTGELVHSLKGKPAAVVEKLRGNSQLAPNTDACAQVGQMLARMHLAGQDFELRQPHLRGLDWWNDTAPMVLPYLSDEQKQLMQNELAYQNHMTALPSYQLLPRGPIHADLFRDNVMFENGKLTGFFDFYFAGDDTWLFDISVCLNDWCIDPSTGMRQAEHTNAFLTAYQEVRALQHVEHEWLNAMLRAAALRFWLSRLWDFYLPREASLLTAHDPRHFERVLRQCVLRPINLITA